MDLVKLLDYGSKIVYYLYKATPGNNIKEVKHYDKTHMRPISQEDREAIDVRARQLVRDRPDFEAKMFIK